MPRCYRRRDVAGYVRAAVRGYGDRSAFAGRRLHLEWLPLSSGTRQTRRIEARQRVRHAEAIRDVGVVPPGGVRAGRRPHIHDGGRGLVDPDGKVFAVSLLPTLSMAKNVTSSCLRR